MKNKTAITIVISCVFIILSTSYGQQKSEWKGKTEYEGGLKVIKNPREPLYGGDVFILEKEFTIGVAEGDDEYSFIRLWYLAVDENENIYAMDQGASKVKVYMPNGKHLRSFGSKGQGPGEFENPNMIFITNHGQLIVEDFIRSLTYFSLSGDFIKSIYTSSLFPTEIAVCPNGQIFAITHEPNPDKYGKNIGLYNKDLGIIKELVHVPELKPVPGIIRIFQPKISWAVTVNNEIILACKNIYEINVFNKSGGLTKKILKDSVPVKVTKEDIEERTSKLEGRKVEAPRNHPAIQSILVDDVGRIIVGTYEKDVTGDYMYDVLDSDGKFIAKVSLPGRVQVMKNNRFYTIGEDEYGYQSVKRYKVTWNY